LCQFYSHPETSFLKTVVLSPAPGGGLLNFVSLFMCDSFFPAKPGFPLSWPPVRFNSFLSETVSWIGEAHCPPRRLQAHSPLPHLPPPIFSTGSTHRLRFFIPQGHNCFLLFFFFFLSPVVRFLFDFVSVRVLSICV